MQMRRATKRCRAPRGNIMDRKYISEYDVHAFIDGALTPARQAEVSTYMAHRLDVATRMTAYRRQGEALRSALAYMAPERLPPQLNLALIIRKRDNRNAAARRRLAVYVLLLGIVLAAGWLLREELQRLQSVNGSRAPRQHLSEANREEKKEEQVRCREPDDAGDTQLPDPCESFPVER
jgi:anti-sigma factor RsiW